ncbi:MAG: UvrD-helicase domain-containing protein [Chloroflexi bacterium]|nr:UvrD-helicase domain-containing protein [Chloroflexota bacterium]
MEDILSGLNPAQREAVEHIQGPVLIVAGPGSGKTRVIAHRVAYLVKEVGVSPRRILAVTFTNKAAREMKERIFRLVGPQAQDITLGTFHALGARILRQEGSHLGLSNTFVIYDEDDQVSAIKRCMQELDLDPKQYNPKAIGAGIEKAKNSLVTPQAYSATAKSYFEEVVGRVYERYQALLSQSQALDFEDLLVMPVRLFQQVPEVLARYQGRYLHVLVDEFQDTNQVQYILAKQLAGRYRNICVVGDPDQSIYSWRYADLRNIMNFERDFPGAKLVYLEQNYRSTKTILEAADHVISLNVERKPKLLWTENEAGAAITLAQTYTEQDEAHFVVSEVEKLLKDEYKPQDVAVLFRTNAQSRALEEAFLRYGIPHQLVGAIRFYQRHEVKDILAYLRVVHNPQDSVSLARIINVPPRGIGARTQEDLARWALQLGVTTYEALQRLSADGPGSSGFPARIARGLTEFYRLIERLRQKGREVGLVELLNTLLEETRYREYLLEHTPDGKDRWDNLLELRTVAGDYQDLPPDEALGAFLEGVSLVSDVDSLDGKLPAVSLITLHQAKGLEFPVVFLTGLEEGLLPHVRSFDSPSQMEEERRLCYVGITRAKERVFLTRAKRRGYQGMQEDGDRLPSRFLKDIPAELIVRPEAPAWRAAPVWAPLPPRPEPVREKPRPLFEKGDLVRHTVFGDGVVISCLPVRDDHEVTVAFKGQAGVKKLMLSFAPLEKRT